MDGLLTGCETGYQRHTCAGLAEGFFGFRDYLPSSEIFVFISGCLFEWAGYFCSSLFSDKQRVLCVVVSAGLQENDQSVE